MTDVANSDDGGCYSNKTDVTSSSARHPASWVRWTALNMAVPDRRRPAAVVRAPTERRATSALTTPPPTSSHRTFRRHTACRSRPDLVRRRSASTSRHTLTTTTPWRRPGPLTTRTRVWQRRPVLTTQRRTTITRSHNSTSPTDISCLQESTRRPVFSADLLLQVHESPLTH